MPTANSTESDGQPGSTPDAGQQGNGGANTHGNPGSNAQSVPAAGQAGTPAAAPAGIPAAQAPGPNFGEVLTAIQSMPEQIVRSLREATQAATPPRAAQGSTDTGDAGTGSQASTQQASGGSSDAGNAQPGKRSFADRWFG